VAVVWVGWTQAQSKASPATPAPRPSGEIARYALTGSLAGYDAVIVEFNFRPGASVPEHRHPGPIAGYVIDGQMKFSIDHEPEKAMPAGSTFFEPRGALHTAFGSADPNAPARVVAFLVVPNGSPLTERVPPRSEP
jgi:quercetin dioxygenase-like cupin family protein